MEQWESLIKDYPAEPTLREFSKTVETAEAVIKDDLAPFEMGLLYFYCDWFLQTLMTSPVHLLSTMQSRCSNRAWSVVNGKCFTMLQGLEDNIMTCEDEIVKTVFLPHPAATRKRGLQLLRVRVLAAAAFPALSLLRNSDMPPTLKAEAAWLLGTICAERPEVIGEREIEIWRAFLLIWEDYNSTIGLCCSVLLGVNGLFKHFGMQLPTLEIDGFYNKLSRNMELLDEEEALLLLTNHAGLFPERLASDINLRAQLWTLAARYTKRKKHDGIDADHRSALTSIYDVIITVNNVKHIVTTEIYDKTRSPQAKVRNIAYPLLSSIISKYKMHLEDISNVFDKQLTTLCLDLEYKLTYKLEMELEDDDAPWKYDSELVNLITQASWCVESKVSNSVCLLRSIILLFDKLPPQKRQLVVHTVLKADTELRTSAIKFLIRESCSRDSSTAAGLPLLPLWRRLFESEGGRERLVLEHSRAVFCDVIDHVLCAFDEFLECSEVDVEKSNLPSLLRLASELIQLENAKDYVTDYIDILLRHLLDCEFNNETSVRFVMHLVEIADENCMFVDGTLTESLVERLQMYYKQLHLNSNRSEGMLCAVSLAVVIAPAIFGDCGAITALQILFARRDVDADILCTALNKLENLMHDSLLHIEEDVLSDIMSQLERIRLRNDTSTKESKTLLRDVTLFLGKYRSEYEEDKTSVHYKMIMKLKNEFMLNVPIASGNNNLQLNLSRTLELALINEEPKSLRSLLLLLCSLLSNKKDQRLQEALTAVIHKLSRCYARLEDSDVSSLSQAITFCDSAQCIKNIVGYITGDKSPGVRKVLSNILEAALLKDPHSEHTETLLRIVIEQALLMMESLNSITKMGGLDLVETIINSLKENNALTVELMPNIIIAILKTNERYTESSLEMAINYFIEKELLFLPAQTSELLKKCYGTLMNVMFAEMNLRFTLKLAVTLMKSLSTDKDILDLILNNENIDKDPVKHLLILSEVKEICQMDVELKRKIICFSDFKLCGVIKNVLVEPKHNYSVYFCLDVVYRFMKDFSEVLLELKYLFTIECFCEAIILTPPEHVKKLYPSLEKCLAALDNVWKTRPQKVTAAFSAWCKNLPIQQIESALERKLYFPEHIIAMAALKKMLTIFKNKDNSLILMDINEIVIKLPRILLNMHNSSNMSVQMKSNMAYLTDIVAVALFFLKRNDVMELTLESHGLKFCQAYIKAFGPYYLESGLLSETAMQPCAILIHDIIRFYGRQDCDSLCSNKIVELLVDLWPTLQAQHTLTELIAVLKDLSFIDTVVLPLTSLPGRWWLDKMAAATTDEQVMLATVLPVFLRCDVDDEVKDLYSASLCTFSTLLPLSSLIPLCRTAEPTVLDMVVATFAKSVSSLSWVAVTSASPARALPVLHALHARALHVQRDGMRVLVHLLVPAIRQAPLRVCEDYFTDKMDSILSDLWRRGLETHKSFLLQYTRAFTLAQLAFEKLPIQFLESPNSKLYSGMTLKTSKTIAQELCKLCYTLRSKVVCPDDADDDLKKIYREFQQANFNCFASVLCKTRPKYFHLLFEQGVWSLIIDSNVTWSLDIQPLWSHKRTKRHILPSTGESEGVTSSTLYTQRIGTFYTRLLSDNPKAYVLSEDTQVEETNIVMKLSDNSINSHACAGAVCAAIAVTSRDPRRPASDVTGWLHHGTDQGQGTNVRCFLAQMIVNCKEELKKCAQPLLYNLLNVIKQTAVTEGSVHRLLNGLHVDIINTIIYWIEDKDTDSRLESVHKSLINDIVDLFKSTFIYYTKERADHRTHIVEDLLKLFGDFIRISKEFVAVEWKAYKYCLQDPITRPICLDMLLALSKNDVYIPNILPDIIVSSNAEHCKKLANIIGLQLKACPDVTMRDVHLSVLSEHFDSLRARDSNAYVKAMYYAQMGYEGCCNQKNFRHIAGLAPKMVGEQKSKCFHIISIYISHSPPSEYIDNMFENVGICDMLTGEFKTMGLNLVKSGLHLMAEGLRRRVVFLISDYCQSSVVKDRKLAFGVMLKAFECIFADKIDTPPAKRLKTDNASKLLEVLAKDDLYNATVVGRVGEGLVDGVPEIAQLVKDGLVPHLSEDVAVRFTECLSVCAVTRPVSRLAALTALVALLFEGQEALMKTCLREAPLVVSAPRSSKLLSMSKTCQGTFRTRVSGASTTKRTATKSISSGSLNLQVTIKDILESLLQFSQCNQDASEALFISVTEGIKKYNNLKLPSVVPVQLSKLVKENKGPLPVAVAASRFCMEDCCDIYGQVATDLESSTKGSQAESLFKLMYEDVYLRSNTNDIFVLGKMNQFMDCMDQTEEVEEFSLKDLLAAFGNLSNWDNLTLQQRSRVRNLNTPIWTDNDSFRMELDDCEELPEWLVKMKMSLTGHSKVEHYLWLKRLNVWPLKLFDVASVTEAVEWHNITCDGDLTKKLPCAIKSVDCLAQWSARLMIRSLYLTSITQSESESSSLTMSQCRRLRLEQELCWAAEANRRGLPELALSCVKRNALDLLESETLPWLHQHVQALRLIALSREQAKIPLKDVLTKTETYTDMYKDSSTPDHLLSMNHMKLLLNKDLSLLTVNKADAILKDIDSNNKDILSDKLYTKKCIKTIISINETAMDYFDRVLEESEDLIQKANIIKAMIARLSRCRDLNCSKTVESFLAVILHRMDLFGMVDPSVVALLLEQIENIAENLNVFFMMELKRLKQTFPDVWNLQRYTKINDILIEMFIEHKYVLCLQLVCDPEYTLLQYVCELKDSIIKNNADEFALTFERISSIFDNPYMGPSFQLLTKYKTFLYDIQRFENTEEYRNKAMPVLNRVIVQLSSVTEPMKGRLNLAELCPALTQPVCNASERDTRYLNRLLGLRDNVYVVRFEKQVEVCHSLRRPCVLLALLSDGRTRGYMVKRGERMRLEEGGRGAHHLLCTSAAVDVNNGYRVTALGEDSGIIERLEDHVTLSTMIARAYNYKDAVDRVRRPSDKELILASSAAMLSQFNELWSFIPAHALRTAIEEDCLCLQDFIRKKRNFTQSCAVMSLYDWILGLGDRHLDNVLYGTLDGATCSVDWAAIFQHGGLNVVPELAPARLTRQIVAVCDLQVLESRLQSILSSLRQTVRFIMPHIHILFKWLPEYSSESFQLKLKLTENIIKGDALSHQVTIQVLEHSSHIENSDKYINLLFEIFEDQPLHDCYDVEQQISCFLQQCTEPKILSVTRSGWQPYL